MTTLQERITQGLKCVPKNALNNSEFNWCEDVYKDGGAISFAKGMQFENAELTAKVVPLLLEMALVIQSVHENLNDSMMPCKTCGDEQDTKSMDVNQDLAKLIARLEAVFPEKDKS